MVHPHGQITKFGQRRSTKDRQMGGLTAQFRVRRAQRCDSLRGPAVLVLVPVGTGGIPLRRRGDQTGAPSTTRLFGTDF